MPNATPHNATDLVLLETPANAGRFVVVCEHASCHIPDGFDGLGMSAAARASHAAWDIGALPVARGLAKRLNATLVAGTVSRLVYDLNRPPHAPDAMPAKSEVFDIPGNAGLSDHDRAQRAQTYDAPFQHALADMLSKTNDPVLVTVHSFTPIYHGQPRAVEIGILHDRDSRLADAMLNTVAHHTTARAERNEPYGPEHGVTRTLIDHGLAHGHLNVMLEVRSDLIGTAAQQDQMAATLAAWLSAALADLGQASDASWSA